MSLKERKEGYSGFEGKQGKGEIEAQNRNNYK